MHFLIPAGSRRGEGRQNRKPVRECKFVDIVSPFCGYKKVMNAFRHFRELTGAHQVLKAPHRLSVLRRQNKNNTPLFSTIFGSEHSIAFYAKAKNIAFFSCFFLSDLLADAFNLIFYYCLLNYGRRKKFNEPFCYPATNAIFKNIISIKKI